MKKIVIQATVEVVICKEFKVPNEYEVNGSTPLEIYQELHRQFDDPNEPDMTVGDIDLYPYRVDFGQLIDFEQVTITDEEEQPKPIGIISEPFSVLTENDFDKSGFELSNNVLSPADEWNEFLNILNGTGSDPFKIQMNQLFETWNFSQRNLGNIDQEA